MSNEEFVNKVAEMREAQRAYFKSRRDWHLQEARRLEKEVDAAIAEIRRGPQLF